MSGDSVLIAPGTYLENITLTGKTITLASYYATTNNPAFIGQTVLDGRGGAAVIRIDATAGPATTLVGLTLRNASDGVNSNAKFNFLHNRVTNTGDGIDYETGSGGLVRDCVFEANDDDGIDLDNRVETVIERNTIQNNGDDGIEIRLQSFTGPGLTITIRDNVIKGNREDGIQLIGYPTLSPRKIYIERNLIAANAMAGLGMMCCANTIENYEGASLKQQIYLFHNTFSGNNHGVTGGDSVVAINNIIHGSTNYGMKFTDGGSIAVCNVFYGNGVNYQQSNVVTSVFADPKLGPISQLLPGSAAIDHGTRHLEVRGQVVFDADPSTYRGFAPDIGCYEFGIPLAVPDDVDGLAARLHDPVPNPSRGLTALRLEAPVAGRLRLEILDVAGRQVRLVADRFTPAGRHDFSWDGLDAAGRRVPPGLYIARLTSGTRVESRQLVRLR